jgi:hypothetical protein
MTKNKFINDSGSTGSTGSTGSAILKFIIGVGLILGVCAFVMILTRKCKCKEAYGLSEVNGSEDCAESCYTALKTCIEGNVGAGADLPPEEAQKLCTPEYTRCYKACPR